MVEGKTMVSFSLIEAALIALDAKLDAVGVRHQGPPTEGPRTEGPPIESLQIADADRLVERHFPNLSTDRPALIGPLGDVEQRAALRRLLTRAYSDGHQVMVVRLTGDASFVESRTLGELGPNDRGGGTSLLYLPPLPCPGAVETFQDTVAHLRAPDGCPWDREQTHRSLRQGFQEEAYEVLDALDRDDLELLTEELGDVLLHILLQAQIGSENAEFRLSDVICRVNTKIVYRHPHVFGGLEVDGVDEVLVNWDKLKQAEKEGRVEHRSALDGISPAMPALARAQAIQRHVDRSGVLSASPAELVNRVQEALAHLCDEQGGGDRQECFGNMLFDLSDLARAFRIDVESALRETILHFERRFRELERAQREAGTPS
jgi:tetrapyrrole methylase family protein/MazG family protein